CAIRAFAGRLLKGPGRRSKTAKGPVIRSLHQHERGPHPGTTLVFVSLYNRLLAACKGLLTPPQSGKNRTRATSLLSLARVYSFTPTCRAPHAWPTLDAIAEPWHRRRPHSSQGGLHMLDIFGPRYRTCDGLSRRCFLRAGFLGLAGLSLADHLRLKAA